ncbi:hypothetical protein ANOM_000034 [Aspergillus nomiae NRRL 13137]|uniref:Uncharacterized protein n=1 Tax=Aspergillus nomiae NRRL (strain ATCC 15546 / NRRL 13137 / CBS 260.88 / M93) TaxID=1509407 RepID=A0A0L1JIE3_ASPN3|nr:uncharacterized protein ANOM_000034 [Aspergillus nomiae NRRL 13137]KNG91529.1 hypothetical protein ANOM_000034 [Aspergillus nomiae NRRL 13137]
MRFLSIFAAIVALAPAAMAQGQNPTNCLDECHPYSAGWDKYCDAKHPALYREGPGCFKCCESV